MTGKILICLSVPSVNQQYELYVPDFITIKEVKELLIEAVTELTEGRYRSNGSECLCSKEKNSSLGDEATLFDYGIQNGEHLLLM